MPNFDYIFMKICAQLLNADNDTISDIMLRRRHCSLISARWL